MAVTIKQIAVMAGVSRGTVDRVLHNRPGVKPEVAAHVRKIADDLGFSPNRAGKVLAARKQPLKIGCFLPGVGNLFFEDVIKGFLQAERELADFSVSVEILNKEGYNPDTHINSMDALIADGCDALCLSTVDTPEIRRRVNEIVASGIPVIAVNTDLTGTERLCYVGCDYYKAGSTAGGLLSLMPRNGLNLLIVTGSLNMHGHNERIKGFSRTLMKKNVQYTLVGTFESLDNNEHAYNETLKVLKKHPHINCIYIAAAGVEGVCRAVTELNRQEDIYILSHDETDSTRELVRAGVIDFTLGQEPEMQGYQAVRLMFEYFIGNRQVIPGDYVTDTVIRIKENLR